MMVQLLFVAVFLAQAQTGENQPVFEAATIKPADPQAGGSSSWHTKPGRLIATNQTLKNYIMIAYHVEDYQISGCPKWGDSNRYDINAKLEGPAEVKDDKVRAALQTLLAERFQLAFHRETKSMTTYALVVAKKGFKLKEAEAKGGSSSRSSGGR
jgi:uncharacterized protein (TIGR03435 family)